MMRAMSALSDTAAVSLNQPKLLNLRLTIMVSAGSFSAVCCYAADVTLCCVTEYHQ